MRYELKYAVDLLDKAAITTAIMLHPSSFRRVYPDRKVNNFYFDTPDFHSFHQNVEGHKRRQKTRLRWYGKHELPTNRSVLEIKQKDAELGWKESTAVDASKVIDLDSIASHLSIYLPQNAKLVPVLHNTYLRSYYLSQDGKFRLTVDTQQTYKVPFGIGSSIEIDQFPTIIELKYDMSVRDQAQEITDHLPFRQSKNSKYTNGITHLYF